MKIEQYIPSSEEIKKAEDMMTDIDYISSMERHSTFKYGGKYILKIRELLLTRINKLCSKKILEHEDSPWWDDKYLILEIMKSSDTVVDLNCVSQRLRNDIDVLGSAVKIDIWSVKYASEELKKSEAFRKIV